MKTGYLTLIFALACAARTTPRFCRASSTREAATATSRLFSSARCTRLSSTVSPNSRHQSEASAAVSRGKPSP